MPRVGIGKLPYQHGDTAGESFAAHMAVAVVRNRFGRHRVTQKTMLVKFDALLIAVRIRVEE